MSAEEISLVSSQNGLNSHSHTHSQLLFQDDNLRFNCGGAQPSRHGVVGDSNKTTRELAAIIDDKLFSSNSSAAAVNTASSFPSTTHHHLHHQQGQTQPSPQDFRRNMYRRGPQETDESDSEEDDVDDDDEEDDDVDDDDMNGGGGYNRENSNRNGLKSNRSNNNGAGTSSCNANNTSTSAATITNRANLDKLGNGNGKSKDFPCFGSGEELMVVKDGVGCIGKIENNNEPGVTIAEPDGEIYYSQYLQATTEACGGSGSGRKEGSSFLSESGESLRAILSDPVTGALMDDAMILPCGHSFGTGGIHHVIRLKACYSCAQSISEDSITPNLSLRAAVQAFHREEELQFYRSPKRRRDRFDQDKGSFGDLTVMDHPRSRGVQFPFAVTDRVVIKGNKRTPQRFVGREAVVTTQCLNGWYVVKTLDNAESVKLQYRSLARVSNDPSSKANPSKTTPSWLQSS